MKSTAVLVVAGIAPVVHHTSQDWRDRLVLRIVKFMRIFADKFFAGRYSHRAVVLETVAAVPGMVGGWIVAAPEGPAPHS